MRSWLKKISEDEHVSWLLDNPQLGNSEIVKIAWKYFDTIIPDGMYLLSRIDQRSSGYSDIKISPKEYEVVFQRFPWAANYGNESWANIARAYGECLALSELNYGINWDKGMVLIDHVFDLVHNTGSLFTKAPAEIREWLLGALEVKKHSEYYGLLKYVSSDVKKLALEYMRHTGGSVQWYQNWESQRQSRVAEILSNFDYKFNLSNRSRLVKDVESMRALDLTPSDFVGTLAHPWIVVAYANGDMLDFGESGISLSGVSRVCEDISVLRNSYIVSEFRSSKVKDPPLYWAALECIVPYVDKEKLESMLQTMSSLVPSTLPSEIEYRNFFVVLINDLYTLMGDSSSNLSKLSSLSRQTFFDFYVLTVIDEKSLPEEDKDICLFLKKFTAISLIEDLIIILHQALLSEAAHVKDHYAIANPGSYITKRHSEVIEYVKNLMETHLRNYLVRESFVNWFTREGIIRIDLVSWWMLSDFDQDMFDREAAPVLRNKLMEVLNNNESYIRNAVSSINRSLTPQVRSRYKDSSSFMIMTDIVDDVFGNYISSGLVGESLSPVEYEEVIPDEGSEIEDGSRVRQ